MLIPLLPLSLVLHAASLSPSSLPARGAQEALLTLDRPGRVLISAKSASGTSCELVDHVRGPFAESGVAGRANCTLDELLDAGTYKLRLVSSRKGKGQVALTVTGYKELNPRPVRLERGRELVQKLRPGEQASFWLKLDKHEPVTLRLSGRNVGDVRLWRNGEWLEPISPRDTSPRPIAGQPIYEWWVDQPLEAGVYLLTAYGTAAKAWTDSAAADEDLTVAYGFPGPPPTRHVRLKLPVHGLAAVELPSTPVAAFLARDGASKATTRLSLHRLGEHGASMSPSPEASCEVASKALVPDCSARVQGGSRRVALLRGEPGTTVSLEWAPLQSGAYAEDGAYAPSWGQVPFHGAEGKYLVAMHETPVDIDSPPLGCLLEQESSHLHWTERGADLVEVSPERPFRRAFNYRGNHVLWFQVTRAGRYVFSTSGERKGACELYRVDGQRRTRLGSDGGCRVSVSAAPGRYELRLYGGTEGIETVTAAIDGLKVGSDTPTRTGCTFVGVELSTGPSRLVTTRATEGSLRALYVRPLPLTVSEPLSVIVDGKGSLKVAVAAAKTGLEIRAVGGDVFGCSLGGNSGEVRNGVCVLPASAGELELSNPSASPLSFSMRRVTPPPPAPPPLQAFSPTIAPPPRLAPGASRWFDFDRGQSHSVMFEVSDPGLYHVQTAGLLATSCVIRTPVVQQVGAASGGGRGRNCLVSSYLRPGRYLFTAATLGQSKGRGALTLERRPVKTAASVSSNGEAYFRVEPGELIQQTLRVTRTAEHTLSTAAQAGTLQCRLDDPQGWPVVAVPAPCTSTIRLGKGSYLWTQLPLTVESMRRTSLERAKPTRTLKGNRAHALGLNRWYRAELGKDGKDEFTFEVPAKMSISFALTHAMQGRLFAAGNGKQGKVLELIPPMGPDRARPESRSAPVRAAYRPPPQEAEEQPEAEGGEGEGETGSEEHGGEESYEEPPPEPEPEAEAYGEDEGDPEPAPETLPTADSPPPLGTPIELAAGRYRLVTEHSKGDVAITYALYLRADVFASGVTRTVEVPGRYTVRLPAGGTLRLSSRGDTDVRCRLFDGAGELVTENADQGADWNCAFAEPLDGGDYTLVLEPQTQAPGPTRVSVALAKVTDAPPLSPAPIKLAGGVVRVPIPPPTGDSVQEVSFTARSPFSCALEDASGRVRARQSHVSRCVMLYRSAGEAFRVRLWTLTGGMQLQGALSSRPITAGDRGTLPANAALRVKLAAPGRYRTSAGVHCVSASGGELLQSCGPKASLDAGEWIFSAAGGAEAELGLEEEIEALDSPRAERELLGARPTLIRQRTGRPSIHLLEVTAQLGDRGPPACRLQSGVSHQTDYACYAASDQGESSVARWWTQGQASAPATISRRAVAVPGSTSPLLPGVQTIRWSQGPSVRLALPGEQARLQLSLPAGAWAIQLSPKDAAIDLCVPADRPSPCVLSGSGGSVVVYSPDESQLQAELVLMDKPPRKLALGKLAELVIAAPTQVRAELAAHPAARQLEVRGALRCTTTLSDGARVEGCSARIPAGVGGELVLEAASGDLRAVLAPPGELKAAVVDPGGKATAELGPARALALTGAAVERLITVKTAGVVHVRADTGVCGLVQGASTLAVDGTTAGCSMSRLLEPGSYRLLVRGFADRGLAGTATWTHEPVTELKEGIAREESFIAPTQTRFFRFDTGSPGRIGLGLQVSAELLECAVLDRDQRTVGEGCQQFLQLDKGTWLLAVHAPAKARTLKFRPVLVGLAGAKAEVPDEYLRDFFNRIGVNP